MGPKKFFLTLSVLVALAAVASLSAQDTDSAPQRGRLAIGAEPAGAADKLSEAAAIYRQIMDAPDNGIPEVLIEQANCLAIFPNAPVSGGLSEQKEGWGVGSCRASGHWTSPLFLSLSGGAPGWQVGAEYADVLLVFTEPRSAEFLAAAPLTLGSDLPSRRGPNPGRNVDTQMLPGVYNYARARGVFSGVVLDGAVIGADKRLNKALYGDLADSENPLSGGLKTSIAEADAFTQELAR